MNLVPFDSQGNLPAYLTNASALADINKDVVRAPTFPSMSIKGKVFTLNKGGVKKIVTKPGEDSDEVAQSIGVVVLRANMSAKTFYLKKFDNADSDGMRPDCYSYDGVAPSGNSPAPQSKKCAVCPHNQWGSRVSDSGESKGKACSDNARIAIAAPDSLSDPMLMRVPPASLKNLREGVKLVANRKIPYNAVVMKVSFDPQQASPTLLFKPVGLLNDADYAKASEMYESEIVRAIVGVDETADEPVEVAAPVTTDELDAAIAAREVTEQAKQSSAPPAAEKPAKAKAAAKAKPVTSDELDETLGLTPAPAPAPVAAAPAPVAAPPAAPAASAPSDLLSDLDALLGSSDD